MSLLSVLFGEEDSFPTRHFALGWPSESHYLQPVKLRRNAVERQNSGSQIVKTREGFHVNLDVSQFSPEEINVKTVENEIVVEGKHEEKQDQHGFISRHFVRRYALPEGHDIQTAKSTLSSDGVLTVTVQKAQQLGDDTKSIPITHTGTTHKSIKSSGQEKME